MLSWAYVRVTMLHSAGLQAPQIGADRAMQAKQDPSPDVNSEHNVLCSSTQLDYTHSLTVTAASREGRGEWERTRGPRGKTERVLASTMFEQR